jgi:predicted transcriptional regulator
MSKTHLSVRLKPKLGDRIDALAAAIERPRSYVVEKAIEEYIDREAWQVEAIRKGLADAEAGLLVSHEAIEAWVASWGTANEKPRPKARAKRRLK